jgi:hypothetical protein
MRNRKGYEGLNTDDADGGGGKGGNEKAQPTKKRRRKKKKGGSKTSISMTQEEMDDEGYGYDFVMVFKVWTEDDKLTAYQKKNNLRDIVRRLNRGGLQTFLYFSVTKDEVYCKIRAPLERLKQEGDRIDYNVRLNEEQLQQAAAAGIPGAGIAPINIVDMINASHRAPYEYIYGKYDTDDRLQIVYEKYGPRRIPFRSVDRLKLILTIIDARANQGGCFIDTNMHIERGALEGFYPLHEVGEKDALQRKWVVCCASPGNQPLGDIRDYMGEKIALYFAWLGHYTTWLMSATVGGLVAAINSYIKKKGNPDVPTMPYFGLFMALWTTLFQEFWKRKESTLAMEWGVCGFEEVEQPRPQFKGESIKSPIDGEEILYVNPLVKMQRIFVSVLVILVMIAAVFGVTMAIFIFQDWSVAHHRDCTFAYGDRRNGCAEHKQTPIGPLAAQVII